MKFNRILFPVDFSPNCRIMNPEVELLAKTFNAEVTLLHVFEIPLTWYGSALGEPPLLNEAFVQDGLNRSREKLSNYSLDLPETSVRRIVVEGDPAFQIKQAVDDRKMDLVMMGTHGEGALRRFLVGSVTQKVLHDVACPVWTHSPTRPVSLFNGIRNIVCAIEFDEEAENLLRFAKDTAEALHARIHLVHCVPLEATLPSRYFDQDLHRLLMKMAAEDLARLQALAGTEFPSEIAQLPVAESVASAVEEHQADLVLTGRGKLRSIFGGLRSHSSEIIRDVACPVMSFCTSSKQASDGKAKSSHMHERLVASH